MQREKSSLLSEWQVKQRSATSSASSDEPKVIPLEKT